MKLSILLGQLLISLVLFSGCGKKAKDKSPLIHQITPSMEEIDFNTMMEYNRALQTNNLTALKSVLAKNKSIDLDQPLIDGETPLIMSIRYDYHKIRDFLIDKNVNLNATNVKDETPLMIAVLNNRFSSAEILINKNVLIDEIDQNANTALHLAIMNKKEKMSLFLIKNGANFSLPNNKDKTAADLARDNDDDEITALMRAMMLKQYDVASYKSLLLNGTNAALKAFIKKFPRVIKEYNYINPINLLLDLNDTNLAFANIETLLTFKASPQGTNNSRELPLIKATKLKRIDVVNLLINFDADSNLYDNEGKSPLIYAIEANQPEIVNILLNDGAKKNYTFKKDNINVRVNACNTARMISVSTTEGKENKQEIRQLLGCRTFLWF